MRCHGLLSQDVEFRPDRVIAVPWPVTGEDLDESCVGIIDQGFPGPRKPLHRDGNPYVGYQHERAVELWVGDSDYRERHPVQDQAPAYYVRGASEQVTPRGVA